LKGQSLSNWIEKDLPRTLARILCASACVVVLPFAAQANGPANNIASPGPASSPAANGAGDETFTPMLGQLGKDVMWLPTPDALMDKMLTVARITPQDVVYDLGAGDGKMAIAAARQFGARAIGIEYNARMADLARRNAARAGVANRVRIIQGDIFKEDFSDATVVLLYLLEDINQRLRPTILSLPPGTRVVSNTFSMGDWEPDQVLSAVSAGNGPVSTGYFWVVPAQVQGDWLVQGLDGSQAARLSLSQRYQHIAGLLTTAGKTQALLGASLQGAELQFRFVDASGQLKSAKARMAGNVLQGEVIAPYGQLETPQLPVPFAGQRLR
jgi:SAM-dependent methyltransferase